MTVDNISKYVKNASPEVLKANAKKAGKASVEKRRNKKLLKEYLEALLEVRTKSGLTYADEITAALVGKAISGSEKAYELIRDTLGQKEPEKIEMDTNTINIEITGKDEH